MIDTTRPILRFVALFPHEDIARKCRELQGTLFCAGLPGARSFPPCVPFALTERPLAKNELRVLARYVAESLADGGGKIRVFPNRPVIANCGADIAPRFLGLGVSIPDTVYFPMEGVRTRFSVPSLCVAVVRSEEAAASTEFFSRLEPRPSDFRIGASYLANIALRELPAGTPAFSTEWEIGERVWLPRPK